MKIAWKKITVPLFLILVLFLMQTGPVFAFGPIPTFPPGVGEPSGIPWPAWDCQKVSPPSFACIPALVKLIIDGLLFFSGTVAMIFIVFAGIKYLLSRGDPKQIEGAKHTLTYAIIGLIVVLSAFFILHFLEYITGVPLDFPIFPEPEIPLTPTPTP